jgi:hypothetical protein
MYNANKPIIEGNRPPFDQLRFLQSFSLSVLLWKPVFAPKEINSPS